ncbi:MAG: ABC transporter ATP-binding protein [Clostridia bacterium]|nr:ABC transporter ATP-binding protein [Clostridia bacterium]
MNYALNINTSIQVGDIYLVLFYIKQCRSPLSEIFDRLEEMQTCLNSLKRINRILKEEENENIEEGEYFEDLNGDIEFKNVYMKYTEEEVLQDISLTIKKGEKISIAGKTGAGKTTLTNVLMRLYDIKSGQILINGKDISKISIKSLRQNISYISQNPYIFEDTLRNNIILGNKAITDNEILEIIKLLEASNIYNRFEKRIRSKNKSKRTLNAENYN